MFPNHSGIESSPKSTPNRQTVGVRTPGRSNRGGSRRSPNPNERSLGKKKPRAVFVTTPRLTEPASIYIYMYICGAHVIIVPAQARINKYRACLMCGLRWRRWREHRWCGARRVNTIMPWMWGGGGGVRMGAVDYLEGREKIFGLPVPGSLSYVNLVKRVALSTKQ